MKSYRKIFLAFNLVALSLGSLNAQDKNVGINDNGSNPDPSAMLDVNSSNKGLLIPRVSLSSTTSKDPIGDKVTESLLVYNTATTGDVEPGYYYWDGAKWRPVGSGCNTLDAAYNCGGAGKGRIITANSGPVAVNVPSNIASDAVGFGVVSQNPKGVGIYASASGTGTGKAILAESTSDAFAIYGLKDNSNTISSTIIGFTSSTQSTMGTQGNPGRIVAAVGGASGGNSYGVVGQGNPDSKAYAGVMGNNLRTDGGYGVWGKGAMGVFGQTTRIDTGTAVIGYGGYQLIGNYAGTGVYGVGYYGIFGIAAQKNDPNSYGVYGDYIRGEGGLESGGYLDVTGTKSFKIDHPLDSENKFLKHFCLESPEVLNVYRGNAILDSKGETDVKLPEYFSSININYSYNLTPIGSSAPGLFVKNEVRGNTFSIGGGKPGMKVSWTLYAERNDKFMKEHPEARIVEPLKIEYLRNSSNLPSKFKTNGKPVNQELFLIQDNTTKVRK